MAGSEGLGMVGPGTILESPWIPLAMRACNKKIGKEEGLEKEKEKLDPRRLFSDHIQIDRLILVA
jgi:hypothetical protein